MTRRTPRPPHGSSTRVLLIIAAFGALGALLLVVIAPFTSALAALFPPAYALVAGFHSILPFLARRLLEFRWATTLACALVGVLSIGSTVLGALIIIPLVLTGAGFDVTLLVLRWRGRPREWHFYAAALVTAVLLFGVSLPVMSPHDLGAPLLALTMAGRIAGQLGAVAIAAVLAERVVRAGIMPIVRPASREPRADD